MEAGIRATHGRAGSAVGTRDTSLWRVAPAYAWEQSQGDTAPSTGCRVAGPQKNTYVCGAQPFFAPLLHPVKEESSPKALPGTWRTEHLQWGHHRPPLLAAALLPGGIQLDRHQQEGAAVGSGGTAGLLGGREVSAFTLK